MYLGKIMEVAPTAELFEKSFHPYSEALLAAVPDPDPDSQRIKMILKGDIPSPINPPSGCRFHTRCPKVQDKCLQIEPEFNEIKPSRFVACHFWED